MQTLSADTLTEIEDGSQNVVPRIKATWLDSRNIDNLRAISTSDNYFAKTLDLNPIVFWQLAEPVFTEYMVSQYPYSNIWFLNDTNTTAVNSGILANGTYTGSYTQSQSSVVTDKSTSFNGSGYVEIPHDVRYSVGYWNGALTVEAWINITTGSIEQTIVGKGNVDNTRTIDNGYEWQFKVNSSNKIQFSILNADGTDYVTCESLTAVAVGTWYHVAGTWNGKTLRVYVNGGLVGTASSTSFNINIPITNTSPINIARMPDATEYFRGKINAVAIHNKALHAGEIGKHFSIPYGKTYDSSKNGKVGQFVIVPNQAEIPRGLMSEDTTNRLVRGERYVPHFDRNTFVVLNNTMGNNDFTVELWFKEDGNISANDVETLVAKGRGGVPGGVSNTVLVRSVGMAPTEPNQQNPQIGEQSIAQPITVKKSIPRVVETDSALSISVNPIRRALGIATETDSALSMEVGQGTTINQVIETETAQPITSIKTVAISYPSETDTAQAINDLHSRTIGTAVETDISNTILVSGATPQAVSMEFGIDLEGVSASTSKISAYAYNSAGTKFSVVSTSADYSSSYHHVVMTVKSHVLRLYVDGVLQGSTTITGTRVVSNDSICVARFGASDTPQLFGGDIFNVAIYNDCVFLDEQEIKARYYSTVRQSNWQDYNFTHPFATAEELVNNRFGYGHIWGVLGGKDQSGTTINMSGSYDIAENANTDKSSYYEYGWWGNNLSQTTSLFENGERVVLTFDTLTCNAIGLYSPFEYGGISTYNIFYKNTSNTWVQIGDTWELEGEYIIHTFTNSTSIKGIQLIVYGTKNPQDYAVVCELSPLIVEVLNEDDIVQMNINKTRENYDSSVPFGATAANGCDFVLENTQMRYNPNNGGSDLYGLMVPDVKFDVELGWKNSGGANGLLMNGASGNAQSLKKAHFIPSGNLEISAQVEPTSWTPADINTILSLSFEEIANPNASITSVAGVPSEFGVLYSVPPVGTLNNKYYISDAYNSGTWWEFDPADDSFTTIASRQVGQGPTATVGGNMYVWGNWNVDACRWNGTSWTTLATTPPFQYANATAHSDGFIYLTRSTSTTITITKYNTATDTYTLVETIAVTGSAWSNPCIFSYGSYLYILQERRPTSPSTQYFMRVYKYDPVLDTTTQLASRDGGIDTGGTLINGDEIWFVGGWGDLLNGGFYTSDEIIIYNITSDTWSVGSTLLPHPLSDLNVSTWNNNKFYIFGGYDEDYAGGDYRPYTYKYSLDPVPAQDVGYKFSLLSNGKLRFSYSTDGVTLSDVDSTVATGIVGRGYVKVTTNNTGTDSEVKFYTSTNGTSWTQLGSTVMAGEEILIFDADVDLEVGSTSGAGQYFFDGIIYGVTMKSGIDGVTIANPDFINDPINSDATAFTDSVGNIWNINTAATLNSGGTEYISQGTFYADTYSPDTSGMVNTVNCRDFSKFMQEKAQSTGLIYRDTSIPEAIVGMAKEASVLNSNIEVVLPYSETILRDNPVAYWDFSQTELDNYCFYFDGGTRMTSKRLFYMTKSSLYDATNLLPLHIQFWIKTTSSNGIIFNYGSSGYASEFNIELIGGDIRYTIRNNNTSQVGVSINDGLWHNVAVTIETNNIITYIDGIEVDQMAVTTYNLGGTYGYITLGNKMTTYPNTFGTSFLTGYLDELKIICGTYEDTMSNIAFDPSLNASKFLYGSQYNSLAFFDFSEGSGDTVSSLKDPFNVLSVNGSASWVKSELNVLKDKARFNHGNTYLTEFNFPGATSSETGHAYKFLGSYITVLPRSDFNFDTEMTFEAWIFPLTSGTRTLIEKSNIDGNPSYYFSVGIDSVDRIIFTLNGEQLIGTTYLSMGTWTHVVVVYDNLNVYIYINGVLDTSGVFLATFVDSNDGLIIGSDRTRTNTFYGYISNMSLYSKALTSYDIDRHYKSALIDKVKNFNLLWAQEDSLWGAMLTLALADVGMFYFNEKNKFIYENGFAFYNSIYPQHTTPQLTLDEDTNIINGSQTVELMVNKVNVKVNPTQSLTNATQEIWTANDGESLAATTITTPLISSDSGSGSSVGYATTLNSAGQRVPVFPESGFLKMGYEIIEYESRDDYYFYNLTRGKFNTPVGSYNAGEFVGEAREYNLEWSSSPVIYVKYPFITAVDFDGTVDVDLWSSTSVGGHLVISLNAAFTESDIYQVLQGNNPISGLDNFFAIAGIPAEQTEGSGVQSEVSTDYESKIRKFGLKEITIDNPFIQDAAYAKRVSQFVLDHNSEPVKVITLNTIGLPQLQLGDMIDIGQFTMLSIDAQQYWVMQIGITYDGGVNQTLTLKQVT